jgi:hypothetical protein
MNYCSDGSPCSYPGCRSAEPHDGHVSDGLRVTAVPYTMFRCGGCGWQDGHAAECLWNGLAYAWHSPVRDLPQS